MPTPPFKIRHASVADVKAMARIINGSAELGLMLSKSHSQLYEDIREFHVAIDKQGEVVGVCGLSIVWANLAEVIALAVVPGARGKGLGQRLVRSCMREAKRLGIRRVMTLTYQQKFFEKAGFTVVDRMNLPMKVWSVCVNCPKNQACDEIAMIHEFTSVPEIGGPQDMEALAGPTPRYEVPVQITSIGKPVPPGTRGALTTLGVSGIPPFSGIPAKTP